MSSLKIREPNKATPFSTREIRLVCPHCAGSVYVSLPWNVTAEVRARTVSEAVGEHRRLCTSAPADAGIVYQIDYPRT